MKPMLIAPPRIGQKAQEKDIGSLMPTEGYWT